MSLIKFDEELCIKSKEIFAKDEVITQIWRKHYAPSNKIGNCSNLFRLHMEKRKERWDGDNRNR